VAALLLTAVGGTGRETSLVNVSIYIDGARLGGVVPGDSNTRG
jgi:hypothetical protein